MRGRLGIRVQRRRAVAAIVGAVWLGGCGGSATSFGPRSASLNRPFSSGASRPQSTTATANASTSTAPTPWLAYLTEDGDRHLLVVRDPDGTDAQSLSVRQPAECPPIWLTPGSTLLYAQQTDKGARLVRFDVESQQVTSVAEVDGAAPERLSLSPTGGSVAFLADGELRVCKLDDGSLRALAHRDEGSRVGDFCWSSDGRAVAFDYAADEDKELPDDKQGLQLVDVDSRRIRRLTTNPQDHSPRWQPRGNKILFLRERTLYVVDETGKYSRPWVAEDVTAPVAWSPDGRLVAIVTQPEGDLSLLTVVDGEGNEMATFTGEEKETVVEVVWSFDSRRLVIVVAGEGTARTLNLLAIDDGQHRQVESFETPPLLARR